MSRFIIIIVAGFFVVGEFFVFDYALGRVTEYEVWRIGFKSGSQRRAFKIIQDIKSSFSDDTVYVFGGSGTRELFRTDEFMSRTLRHRFLNCSVSSESPYDSLKLMSAVKGENKIMIYGIHPKSFYEYDESRAVDGYYRGGYAYKYPIAYGWPLSETYIESAEHKLKLFINLNPYVDLLKIYFRNHPFWDRGSYKLNSELPKQYFYSNAVLDAEKLNRKLSKFMMTIEKNKYDNLNINFEILEVMIELAEKENRKFVLFELPISPIIHETFNEELEIYYKKVDLILKKFPEVTFLSQNNYSDIRQEFFYDTLHVNETGRHAFSSDILNSLSEIVDVEH